MSKKSDLSSEALIELHIEAATIQVSVRLAYYGYFLADELAHHMPQHTRPMLAAALERMVLSGKAEITFDRCYGLTWGERARVRALFPPEAGNMPVDVSSQTATSAPGRP
jgi:hypothetical protein